MGGGHGYPLRDIARPAFEGLADGFLYSYLPTREDPLASSAGPATLTCRSATLSRIVGANSRRTAAIAWTARGERHCARRSRDSAWASVPPAT